MYAVDVVVTPTIQKQYTGYGIYLGQGLVITAAHLVGHSLPLRELRVHAMGQDLPAELIKTGSFEEIDLALLSVEENRLPVALRLRRNPLCNDPPRIGMDVVDVTPERTARARVISPLLIAPALRSRFDALIDSPQNSGSGIFDPDKRCLLGIVSAKVQRLIYRRTKGPINVNSDKFAGYFVSAAKILSFIPVEFHLLIRSGPKD